jgi:hypothetical protein
LSQARLDCGGFEAVGVARGHDEDNPVADFLVLEPERDGVADETGLLRHLLDLARAHPITRGLDHIVTPSDEV